MEEEKRRLIKEPVYEALWMWRWNLEYREALRKVTIVVIACKYLLPGRMPQRRELLPIKGRENFQVQGSWVIPQKIKFYRS